jgi:hypothetical protein
MKISQSSREKKRNEKIKESLNKYIIKNKKEILLTGNKRYESKSGEYYLKNKKDNIYLIPIPISKRPSSSINSNDYSKNNLRKAKEKAILLRRIRYSYDVKERTNQSIENLAYKIYNKNSIILIQRWWRTLISVIFIQKVFRGFYFRKNKHFILGKKTFRKIYDNMKDKVTKKISDKIPIMYNIKKNNFTPQHNQKTHKLIKVSPKLRKNHSNEIIISDKNKKKINSNVLDLIRKIKIKYIKYFDKK